MAVPLRSPDGKNCTLPVAPLAEKVGLDSACSTPSRVLFCFKPVIIASVLGLDSLSYQS